MKIAIQNGSVTLSGNTILEMVNFEVNKGDHIAIVGPNGSGKTTLLKALINNELFDEGIGEEKFTITKIGEFNIGYLEQMEFTDENSTLLEEVRKPLINVIKMEETLEKLVEEMNNNNSSNLIDKYTELQEQFKLLGGYSYKTEYEVMLNKFGFKEEDKNKTISTFSGGEKTKIAFIKLLLSNPDLLILDEPTNHLDIKTIEWLEDYLKNYKGSIIVVSHDRYFINSIADFVYDIDYGKVVKYSGNYTYYEKMKKENYDKLLKDYNAQQMEIKRLMSIYERFKSKPTKAKMALSKLKQVEKMDLIAKPNKIDMNTFRTSLKQIEPSVKKVLTVKDLQIGYDKPLAKISFEVKRGKKIGIIGANGTGKSTLLKTITGELTPIDGELSYGLHVSPGYFNQNLSFKTNDDVLTEMLASNPLLSQEQARSALGSFLFKGDDVFTKLESLSGGERVRLQLCKILYEKPNFLILDEPTNHMDIANKEHLEELLLEYPGTILFVSHDRYFVEKLADELIVFEDNGCSYYNYGYKEYKGAKEKLAEKKVNKPIKKVQKKNIEANEVRENINNYKKELNTIENRIIKLETKMSEYKEEIFNTPYEDYQKINSINSKIQSVEDELNKLNKEWERITDFLIQKED